MQPRWQDIYSDLLQHLQPQPQVQPQAQAQQQPQAQPQPQPQPQAQAQAQQQPQAQAQQQPQAAGVQHKPPRAGSSPQRAAQHRYRARHKQLVQDMEARAAAKQAQLQVLEEQHAALQAKARALDVMLASAGHNMAAVQRMGQLSLQTSHPLLSPASPPRDAASRNPIASLPSAPSSSGDASRDGEPGMQPPAHAAASAAPIELGLPQPTPLQLHLQSVMPRLQQAFKSLAEEYSRLVIAGLQYPETADSPAAARLLSTQQQVHAEVQAFAAENPIAVTQLRSLNMETGAFESPPPPEHYSRAAQLLQERLDASVMYNACVACKLHLDALAKIKEERSALLQRLQVALTDSVARSDYSSDCICSWASDSRVVLHDLLDAIDASLWREFVLEGVAASTYRLPLLVTAELWVACYPWCPDRTGIIAQLLPSVLAARDNTTGEQLAARSSGD